MRPGRFCVAILALVLLAAVAPPGFGAADGIVWTEVELLFMEKHPVIRVGIDPGFVPFEFIDENGEYKGISADYIALISEKTGLKFEVVGGLTWPEAYDLALNGGIDVLPAVGKTSEREQRFLFSEPYYFYKRVIVTRDTDTISGIGDLAGQAVAVQRNSSHHSYLLSFQHINLSLYDSVEAALTAVATGEERAFVGNLATTNYLIRSNGLTNLRFVAFEAEKHHSLHFAVRKDWPELVSIINKALASIDESEKLAISNRWVALEADVNYGPILRVVLGVGAAVAAVLIVSFFWIARLRREIRRRKEIQADLEKAKREAEEANAFKSKFLARMSHEIRTPLSAITGMSYLLKKTETTLTQRMYIDRIMQAASIMLSIINDILDFSKIEAGKVQIETASFSMDQLIQDVVNIVSYRINEQKIGFRLSKDPDVPNWFFGDAKRIEQILLNVLSNAVKFTQEGEVSLDIRLIAKESDTYHISFTVRDTGIGMTEEQIEKLFKPFEQGDSSITRRFGGSGLGLAIVKSFVDMMGGEIKVFSTSGEGTTVIVSLALPVDREKEDVYKKALSARQFRELRALVLEKTGANMNLIESYLCSFGMQCELTSSETSAVSILEAAERTFARPFDLLIVDYETPSKGGFQFVDALRRSGKIIKMPKIMMLLPMMREDLFDQLAEHGIDMGIGKPIIPSILLNAVLDLFNLKAVSGCSRRAEKGEKEPAKLEKPRTVLLAEDNKTNQLVAKSLLEQVGAGTIIAGDGEEAVKLYQENRDVIDLILMDLHMPVMDGYEAAEKIREISPDVPIVAMTADVVLGVRDKCERYGMYHYISKPFHPERFVETVKEILLQSGHEKAGGSVLDRGMGLRNMGGNEELYRKVLGEYLGENRETPDRLEEAVRAGRYADAAHIVHKIASSSGSIGASALHETAAALYTALKNGKGDDILPLKDRFVTLLRKLLKELETSERLAE